MKMNEIYEAPQMELVKVCVEAGFLGSVETGGDGHAPGEGDGQDAPF